MRENEIAFMKLFEEQILPNRKNVGIAILKQAADLIGIGINTSCRSCAQKSSIDLLNAYSRLTPAYNIYKDNKKEEVQYTQVVEPKPIDNVMITQTTYDVDIKTGEITETDEVIIKRPIPPVKLKKNEI